ncbi:hypothetical protein [Nonomuraea typhae]|uniref:LysM domain-containing protein n=1 Tax=Nonomuraea typhae TaxID=2603600 RepID=A0ABW7YNQ3_9ACTN
MRSRKRAVALTSSTLLATAVLMGASPAAHAIPENCTTSQPAVNRVAGYCATGTGEHQVAVTVLHVNPAVGWVANVGPWVPAGQVSEAGLPPGTIMSLRINKR